jgi:anaerobic selenocysteine-containing dehydrogenase
MDRRRPTLLAAAAVVSLVVSLGAWWWFSEAQASARAHEGALALWESQEPEAYSFEFTSCSGMCARECPDRITVTGGEVTDVTPTRPGCTPASHDEAPTIEDVFALEEWSRSLESTDSFDIDYDRAWGFPSAGNFTCPDGWADCGSGFAVTAFHVEP